MFINRNCGICRERVPRINNLTQSYASKEEQKVAIKIHELHKIKGLTGGSRLVIN